MTSALAWLILLVLRAFREVDEERESGPRTRQPCELAALRF